jgi:hypothetical protein
MGMTKTKSTGAKKSEKPSKEIAKPSKEIAKPGKGGAKAAKKSAAAAKKSATPAKKRAVKALSADERQRLLKPADGFTELSERFVTAWKTNRSLKVSGASPAKIASALTRAKKAAAREETLKRKLEEKLRPLQDARLQAEHDVWKLVLDVYAVAKAQARISPELGRAFAFMGESLSKRARPKEAAAGGAAAASPPATPGIE